MAGFKRTGGFLAACLLILFISRPWPRRRRGPRPRHMLEASAPISLDFGRGSSAAAASLLESESKAYETPKLDDEDVVDESEVSLSNSLPPRLPIAKADNPLFKAYEAVLNEQLHLPERQRRYIVGRPVSGLGNKLRALYLVMSLALQQRRILLLDDDFIVPLYPHVFPSPFKPWLASDVRWVKAELAQHDLRDRGKPVHTSSNTSVAHFFHRNKDKSREWSCWEKAGVIVACGGGQDTQIIVIETNQPAAESLLATITADLEKIAAAQSASAAGPVAGPTGTVALRRYLYYTLFPAPGHGLRRAIAKAKKGMGWEDPSSATGSSSNGKQIAIAPISSAEKYKLVVGIHMRLFVDAKTWHTEWGKIAPGYWRCVTKTISDAQAEYGATKGDTLVYIASDKPAARPWAARKLNNLATVRWHNPSSTFVNSRDSQSADALRTIVTDWTLLSDAHVIIGSAKSSFATAAGSRSGSRVVVASLAGDKCRVVQRGLQLG